MENKEKMYMEMVTKMMELIHMIKMMELMIHMMIHMMKIMELVIH